MHTIAVLQAYLLKEADEAGGVAPSPACRSSDLALCATCCSGHHREALLSELMEKDGSFLLVALVLSVGLFSTAVETVVCKLREARVKSAAFQR